MEKYTNPVAVITTIYNGDDVFYAQKALNSLFCQTFIGDINIYIHIDGNLDTEHVELLDKYRDKFKCIIQSNPSIGLAKGLNKLMGIVSEEFVFRMDLDDIAIPERFEKQIEYIIEHDCDLIGSNSYEIDENDNIECARNYPNTPNDVKQALMKYSPVLHPSFCFRKKIFDAGFSYPDYYLTEDLAFISNVVHGGYVVSNHPERLMKWRKTKEFYNRRNIKRSLVEFSVYIRNVYWFSPVSFFYLYPISRLIFRFVPKFIVKRVYNSRLRNSL